MSTRLPEFLSFFRFFASFCIGQISHHQYRCLTVCLIVYLFPFQTPRIVEAAERGGKLMDLPSPHQDVVKEGMLSCKTVLSDGKVCTLKYEGAEGGGGGVR